MADSILEKNSQQNFIPQGITFVKTNLLDIIYKNLSQVKNPFVLVSHEEDLGVDYYLNEFQIETILNNPLLKNSFFLKFSGI